MADKIKSSMLVALILVSLSLVFGAYFFTQERTKNAALTKEIGELQKDKKLNEAKIEEYGRKISEAEAQLNDSQAQLAALNDQLAQEKTEKTKVTAQIDQFKNDLEQQKKLKADLESKLNLSQTELKKVQGQLRELNGKKTELESRISEMEAKAQQAQSGVELGTIVVGQESNQSPGVDLGNAPPAVAIATTGAPAVASASAPAGQAKVLVVNKDYNFAVLNIGTKDGVTVGAMFSVYRDDKFLGDVKVEKVHDSMAAAGFVTEGLKEKISEGDRVVPKA